MRNNRRRRPARGWILAAAVVAGCAAPEAEPEQSGAGALPAAPPEADHFVPSSRRT